MRVIHASWILGTYLPPSATLYKDLRSSYHPGTRYVASSPSYPYMFLRTSCLLRTLDMARAQKNIYNRWDSLMATAGLLTGWRVA